MPREPEKLPNPETWKFVLVHRFIRHRIPLKVYGHSVTLTSFLTVFRGEVVPTIVTSDPVAALGARRRGWLDITAEVECAVDHYWDRNAGSWKVDQNGLLPWEYKIPPVRGPLPIEPLPVVKVQSIAIEPDPGEPAPKKKSPLRGAAARGSSPSVRPKN